MRFPITGYYSILAVASVACVATTVSCVAASVGILAEKNKQDKDENNPQNAIIIKVKATTTHKNFLRIKSELFVTVIDYGKTAQKVTFFSNFKKYFLLK